MPPRPAPSLSPYRFIVGFGVVSLFMDIVYQGALAVQGPLLASLGASAVVVGVVSGLGEATALAGRVVTGPWADRTRRYWTFALLGYLATAVTVPLMGVAGSALAVAALVILERLGKSIRTPSRDAMLASAAVRVGTGRGFALHEVLDQIGAVIGPLAVSWVLAVTAHNYAPALGMLAVPGVIAIVLLLFLRHRVPNPAGFENAPAAAGPAASAAPAASAPPSSLRQAPGFWQYLLFTFLTTSGLATFGVLSFHMVRGAGFTDAQVPALYAVAMAVDAGAAVLAGLAYDRFHLRALFLLPALAVVLPVLAFDDDAARVIAGVMLWAVITGIQESTMRAAVADVAPAGARAGAFGYFAITLGIGALVGGVMAGWLSQRSVPGLIAYTAVVQAAALAVLVVLDRRLSATRPRPRAARGPDAPN